MVSYQALFTPEDDWFIITFPDFDWGFSNGQGEDDSREMAADLLQTLVRQLMVEGRDLPAPRKHRGRNFRTIALPAMESAKVQLYQAIRASKLSETVLARELGISKAELNRLVDLKYKSRFSQIEAAFRALGKRVVLSVEDAA